MTSTGAALLNTGPSIWFPMCGPPKDGTVIEGRYRDGTQRLTRWVKTSDYEGWDTGAMIAPVEWRPHHAKV